MSYILRFLSLIVLILLSLSLVRYGLKNYGLAQPLSQYQTPLIARLSEKPRPILWTNSDPKKNSGTYGSYSVQFKEDHWILSRLEDEILLSDYKTDEENGIILLWPEINGPTLIPSLRSQLKESGLWKKVIFCSRNDGVLKDLRELEPQWSFCNGEIFLTKMLSLESVGLESLLKIKSDVFFIHLKNLPLQNKIHSLIKEAKRQGRFVIMGPVQEPIKEYEVDGWLLY